MLGQGGSCSLSADAIISLSLPLQTVSISWSTRVEFILSAFGVVLGFSPLARNQVLLLILYSFIDLIIKFTRNLQLLIHLFAVGDVLLGTDIVISDILSAINMNGTLRIINTPTILFIRVCINFIFTSVLCYDLGVI